MAGKFAVLVGLAYVVAALACDGDPELDLCDMAKHEDETNHGFRAVPTLFAVMATVGVGGDRGIVLAATVGAVLGLPEAAAMTCGDVKTKYQEQECCGMPDKDIPSAALCGYSFEKPACDDAEPQAPRDLSGCPSACAVGSLTPKQATLTDAQAEFLPLVNVHYHLGAEHKSDSYSDSTDTDAYESSNSGRRLADNVRPGLKCNAAVTDTAYTFQYCKGDVAVGKTYEVHYVHSSAGYSYEDLVGVDADGIEDGLGGAANGKGQLNPMIVVQGQVFQIATATDGGEIVTDMLHGWTVVGHNHSIMYPGSTTGQSHDDEICSPYQITWHVDLECHKVTPESFDNMCKQMKDLYNLEADLYPHGSRSPVATAYVAAAEYVKPLA